jgi:hypothetical protein
MLFVSFFIFGVLDVWDAGAQTQKLRMAYVSPSGALAVPWIAKEAGLFEKNGVEVELVFIRGASTMIQTLVSGDIDLAHVAANPAVEANLGGADVVVLVPPKPASRLLHDGPTRSEERESGGAAGITALIGDDLLAASPFGSSTSSLIAMSLSFNWVASPRSHGLRLKLSCRLALRR